MARKKRMVAMVRASDRRKRDSFPEVRGWNQMMGADISRLQASEDYINKRDKMRHYGLILIRSLPIHGYRKWWQRLLPPAATKWNRADMVFSFSPVCRCTCGNVTMECERKISVSLATLSITKSIEYSHLKNSPKLHRRWGGVWARMIVRSEY